MTGSLASAIMALLSAQGQTPRRVVADSRKPAAGKFIERVGFYDPKAPEGRENLRVAMDRLSFWQGKGAQLSPTVARLVKQFGKKVAGTAAAATA